MRGTFANIRLRNLLAPGTEGGVTVHLPSAEQSSIYERGDALRARRASSSSCWPARSTARAPRATGRPRAPSCSAVRAVVAQSFERIHRSNLVGMGVCHCSSPTVSSAQSLELTGEEVFSIDGVAESVAAVEGGAGDGDVAVRAEARGREHGRLRSPPAYRHGRARPSTSATEASCSTSCVCCRSMSDHERRAHPARNLRGPRRPRARPWRGAAGRAAAPARLVERTRSVRLRGRHRRWSGREAASAFAEASTDVVGTPLALVSAKHGFESPPRGCLVMGHIDEIGLIVTHIDRRGLSLVSSGRAAGMRRSSSANGC